MLTQSLLFTPGCMPVCVIIFLLERNSYVCFLGTIQMNEKRVIFTDRLRIAA
jgi:hypothetical protein